MEILTKVYRHFVLVKIIGRVDSTTSPEAEAALDKLIAEESAKIILDLAEVDYISSSGLRMLIVMQRKLSQKQGVLALVNLSERVRESLDLSGLLSIFSVFTDIETAMKEI